MLCKGQNLIELSSGPSVSVSDHRVPLSGYFCLVYYLLSSDHELYKNPSNTVMPNSLEPIQHSLLDDP